MEGKRASTKKEVETAVLTKSARRCCFCFGINNDYEEKQGQIAHIDKDRTNSKEDNLVFLCLEHHDRYDSKTSQSKNLTKEELQHYKEKLYKHVASFTIDKKSSPINLVKVYEKAKSYFTYEFDQNSWNFENNEFNIKINFSLHKIDNPIVTVKEKEDNIYKIVGVEVQNINDDIIILSSHNFIGQMIIK